MAISAEHSLILQPFVGVDDVSKWVKIFEWDENLQTNQTKTRLWLRIVMLYHSDICRCI